MTINNLDLFKSIINHLENSIIQLKSSLEQINKSNDSVIINNCDYKCNNKIITDKEIPIINTNNEISNHEIDDDNLLENFINDQNDDQETQNIKVQQKFDYSYVYQCNPKSKISYVESERQSDSEIFVRNQYDQINEEILNVKKLSLDQNNNNNNRSPSTSNLKTNTMKIDQYTGKNEIFKQNQEKFIQKRRYSSNPLNGISKRSENQNAHDVSSEASQNDGIYVSQSKKDRKKNIKFSLKSMKKQSIIDTSQIETFKLSIDIYDSLKIFIPQDEHSKNIQIYQINQFQIEENSLFNFFWNFIITMILLFQILAFPFENQSETWINDYFFQNMVNLILEYILIVDILLNFITCYRDEYGNMNTQSSSIAINYISSWFLLDIIASFPSYNFEQFDIVPFDYKTEYLRILKLPKYFRILRVSASLFSSRTSKIINLDYFISFTSSELNKQFNLIKQSSQFAVLVNMLACYLISFTHTCQSEIECQNWFFQIIKDDQNSAILDPNLPQYSIVTKFQEQQLDDSSALLAYQNWAQNGRTLLYLDAQQFILQSVTTVGQGDLQTFNSQERLFRSFVMIIGAIMFTILSSSIIETTIAETLNIQKQKEHEAMIEKIQIKYNLRGESKRFLQLLGDSVQTENLNNELKFTKLLPDQMSEVVLKYIYQIYLKKIKLLQSESYNFFLNLMEVSTFRRCIIDETIETEFKQMAIVYSGQIGCQVSNLKDFLHHDQLQHLEVGEDFGYNCYINFPNKSQNNQVQICTSNSELVQISAQKFIKLMSNSINSVEQVQNKIIDYLIEVYLMVALQQSMLKVGYQIDQKWQNRTMSLLKFNPSDFKIMDTLFLNFTEAINKRTIDSHNTNWQDHVMDISIYKQIQGKIKSIQQEIVSDEYELLKSNVSIKVKGRSSSQNLINQLN